MSRNPETGEQVKEGDEVPFWSYNTISGEWSYERLLHMSRSPSGLRTSMSLSHLSWWNIDWFIGQVCEFVEFFFTDKSSYFVYSKHFIGGYNSIYISLQIRDLYFELNTSLWVIVYDIFSYNIIFLAL